MARVVCAGCVVLGARGTWPGVAAGHHLVDVRRPPIARDARATAGEPSHLLPGAALANEPDRRQRDDRRECERCMYRTIQVPALGIPTGDATDIRRHVSPSSRA